MAHIEHGKPISLEQAWTAYRHQVCPGLPDGPAEFVRTAFFCGATALHSAQLQCGTGEKGVEQMTVLISEVESFMQVLMMRAAMERASNVNTKGHA